MADPVIRCYLNPPILTVEDYEAIEREVTARILCGAHGPGDRVLAQLLEDHRWRYRECKDVLANDGHGSTDGQER